MPFMSRADRGSKAFGHRGVLPEPAGASMCAPQKAINPEGSPLPRLQFCPPRLGKLPGPLAGCDPVGETR